MQPTYLAKEAAKSKLPWCSVRRAAFPLNSVKWEAFAFFFQTLHELAKSFLGESLCVRNKNLPRMRSLLRLLRGWCHSNSSGSLKMTAGAGGGCICFGERGFFFFFPGKIGRKRNANLSCSSQATQHNIRHLYVVALPAAGVQRQCRKEEITTCP